MVLKKIKKKNQIIVCKTQFFTGSFMKTTDSLRFFNNLNWWFLHYDFFSKNQNRGVSDFWNIKKPWTNGY
jgi:hypothetical protein